MGMKLLERDYLAELLALRQGYTTRYYKELNNEIPLLEGERAYLEMKAAEGTSSQKRYSFKKRIELKTQQIEKKKKELEAPFPLDLKWHLKPVEMKLLGNPCKVKLSVSNDEISMALLDKQLEEPLMLSASLQSCEAMVKIPRDKPSWGNRVLEAKDKQSAIVENVRRQLSDSKFYVYKCSLYFFDQSDIHSADEQKLLIKEDYFKRDKRFANLRKEMARFEKLSSGNVESREPIPQEVRFAVWRRDEGRCVSCGSNQKLEYDHIIPVSKGGSSTERNIQLLCEKCNREKSAKI